MYDILPWIGVAILLVLALPIPAVQKLLLEVSVWALRMGVVALLAGGVYLWFRPGELPAGISNVLADIPGLVALLPERGTPAFGLCLACWAVTLLLPLLAALDAGRRVVRVRTPVAATWHTPEVLPTAEPVEEMGVPILRPVERRTAAAALAAAGSRGR